MRKSEREVKNLEDIVNILDRCETVRIGINGNEYPYVVPVSFGYEVADGKVVIYFHGAKEGFKHDLIAKNNKVCVEADIFHCYAETGHSVTTEYESVIGFGIAKKAEQDDAIKGIDLLLNHCKIEGYSAAECVSLGTTTVYKIVLNSITGKKRVVD